MSNVWDPEKNDFGSLKKKVVVITGKQNQALRHPWAVGLSKIGAANGIGAATVERLHENGANVVFGNL